MDGKSAPAPSTITVYDLRLRLRETLDRVVYFDERFVVTRNGLPVAVIVGVESYRRWVGVGERPQAPGASMNADEIRG